MARERPESAHNGHSVSHCANGSSCPRPWKNALAKAVDALCLAGERAETAIDRLASAA